ncbi:TPA: hypothetical protein ACH3X1_003554 [Trebouxia sp. C0004]
MEAATDTQRLQLTLQELIDFLGKTYITTCEEVARTEYAVQSSMQIVQELQAALSQRNDVFADQCDAPSIPASSKIGQMPTSSYLVHRAEAEESPTPVAASAADLSGPASAQSAQHDKLQAVLAQARAIRGQDKPQASIASNPQSMSHVGKTMPRNPTGTGTGAAAQGCAFRSMPDRTNRLQLHAKLSSGTSGRSSRGESVSAKPQRDDTALSKHHKPPKQHPPLNSMPDRETAAATPMQMQQQLLQHKLVSGSSVLQSTPAELDQLHSMESKWAQTMPLQLPAYFRKALNAFRQPSSQRQSQSAAGAASSSCCPCISLTDTYNESLASIADAGKAFQDAVTAAGTPQEQAKQSWANPEAQR